MILIDFTQTIIAGLMVQLKMNNGEVSEDMLRHMILNSVRGYQRKYAAEYGEITLCTDASHPWRRDYFPQYKANRKKSREADNKDWGLIFDTLHKVKMEIKENFPYRYMYVEKCEADDIIAVLTKHAPFGEKVMIVSGDKDFQQLHKYKYVTQWSPNLNKLITVEDPDLFLREHILTGDKSDGVPNILSADNCLAVGERQKPMTKKRIELFSAHPEEMDEETKLRYNRNKQMIDLTMIPQEYQDSILENYNNQEEVGRSHLFNYFVKQKLKNLIGDLQDF